AGTIVVIVGLTIEYAASSVVGWIVTIVGLVPLMAGMFDICVFAPLLGRPFMGARLREALVVEDGEFVAAESAEDDDTPAEDPAADYDEDDDEEPVAEYAEEHVDDDAYEAEVLD
ncbi:MAG: DUF2892 domain-containing protein, partial [Anaerolineae bacterium]|nr:DUF2892 domain-containing protein [Anaerolineae bacterium]